MYVFIYRATPMSDGHGCMDIINMENFPEEILFIRITLSYIDS